MQTLKGIISAAVIIMGAALLGGCESYQVNDRMYVSMAGASRDGSGYTLAVQSFDTSAAEEKSAPAYKVYTGRGKSLAEAADNIALETGKKLYMGQCRTLFADKHIISSREELTALTEMSVPPGCSIFYSPFPERSVDSGKDGESEGAEEKKAKIDRLTTDGVFAPVSIRDIYNLDAKKNPAAVPFYSEGVKGTALLFPDSRTLLLDSEESRVYDMLCHKGAVSFYREEGVLSLDCEKPRIYIYSGGEAPVLTVSVNANAVNIPAGCEPRSIIPETESKMSALLTRACAEGFYKCFDCFKDTELSEIPEAVTVHICLSESRSGRNILQSIMLD